MMPASVKARVTRATCSTVTPFFISASRRSDATSSPPLTATQPDRASSSASSGVKAFSKRMLPHQVIDDRARDQPLGQRAQRRGRRGLVDEVEAGLAGLGDQRLDAVDQQVGGRDLVAADVVERDVAERALLPVAAVRDRQLVPAAVGPQPVHRVEHLEQREVAIERQPVVGRRAGVPRGDVVRPDRCVSSTTRPASRTKVRQQRLARLALTAQVLEQREQRPLAVVEGDEVDVVEHARVGQLAQLGVDVAAAEHDPGRGGARP